MIDNSNNFYNLNHKNNFYANENNNNNNNKFNINSNFIFTISYQINRSNSNLNHHNHISSNDFNDNSSIVKRGYQDNFKPINFFLRNDFARTKSTKTQNKRRSPS